MRRGRTAVRKTFWEKYGCLVKAGSAALFSICVVATMVLFFVLSLPAAVDQLSEQSVQLVAGSLGIER